MFTILVASAAKTFAKSIKNAKAKMRGRVGVAVAANLVASFVSFGI